MVQTPGVSRFFGCRPIGPVAWATVLGWSVAGAAGAELVPRWMELRAAQAAADGPVTVTAAGVLPGPADRDGDDNGDGDGDGRGETITGAGVGRGSVPAPDPT